MAKKQTENAIQNHIIGWIRRDLYGVEVIAIRNEDMRTRADEIIAGHPDLVIETVHAGLCHTLKLELKTKSGKLSPAQINWANHFTPSVNRITRVAYGFDDAQAIVSAWLGRVRGGNTIP